MKFTDLLTILLQGPGMQFIVISLKTGFFQGSETLVGVYRDQGANSSKVLTLDVRFVPAFPSFSLSFCLFLVDMSEWVR